HAGSLLAEISLPKLIASWLMLVVIPAIALGVTPLVVSAWAAKIVGKFSAPLLGLLPIALLLAVLALGWLFGRRLFRLAETSFWSLNALAIEPAYAMCREGFRHMTDRTSDPQLRRRRHFLATALAGLVV